MHSEISNKPIVKFSDSVSSYFEELTETLFWKDYFGFIDSALDYVSNMKDYIEKYIAIMPNYIAPDYFDKYQKGMRYMTYQANKRTTWYIFFKQSDNRFMIYYITNNHYEGQYIR